MKNPGKQMLKALAILLLPVMVFFILALYSENVESRKQKEMVQLSQDSLLAVNQMLEKEIFLLKRDIDSLKLKVKN